MNTKKEGFWKLATKSEKTTLVILFGAFLSTLLFGGGLEVSDAMSTVTIAYFSVLFILVIIMSLVVHKVNKRAKVKDV